ncbi:MAG: glycosyltransferase family 39 protein [Thermodesulfobacteriota bacterium]
MQALSETRLRLLLLAMALLQAVFLVVRARPYGGEAYPLVAALAAAGFVAALAIALLPEAAAESLHGLLLRGAATRRRALALLTAITLAVGVATVFTQQEPSWDEKWVLWAAEVYARGGAQELFARYGENPWLGPQHPPLVPMLYGTLADLVGPRLKALRLLNLVFGCGAVAVTYLILEQLYDRATALVAGLVLLASPLFVRIASAATNDMPLTFVFLLALLLALRLVRSRRDALAVALGLVIGVGLLVKYTMLLVFPVLLGLGVAFACMPLLRRHAPVVLAISFALLLLWLDHAYESGILAAQGERFVRLATVSSRSPGWALDSIVTKTPSALGVYVVPWVLLGAVDAVRRRRAEDAFVLAWIGLVSIPLVLTLPDNRYFLPAFPAFALLAARALLARPAWTVPALTLAWVLCGLTLAFYARIDLAQKVFLFR